MMDIKQVGMIFVAVSVLGTIPDARANSFTFDLLPPSGSVFGEPGSTVGWGYSLENASATEWLLLSSVGSDPFLHGVPDGSIFDFPILGPGVILGTPYVPGTSGLFELTWDLTAPIGFANSGTFLVSAEWWDGDPFAGGAFLRFAIDQSAAYSATVTPNSAAPEPGVLLLVLAGLTGIAWRKRRRHS
jgi:hypothetical protein